MVNVVPRIDSAMATLMSGIPTGQLSELTLPIKQVLNQMFGSVDAEVIAQEGLVATSNFLAPKMRPVGSGSTSDMEFRAYQRSVLALSNTPQANYISLYAFKKMTENSIRNNRLEKELLADEKINDIATINEAIYGQDTGIFEKLPPEINRNDDAAVQAWWDSLPDGAVIDNSYRIIDMDDPYVIKGFKVIGQ